MDVRRGGPDQAFQRFLLRLPSACAAISATLVLGQEVCTARVAWARRAWYEKTSTPAPQAYVDPRQDPADRTRTPKRSLAGEKRWFMTQTQAAWWSRRATTTRLWTQSPGGAV